MTAAPDRKRIHSSRKTAYTPRPLPVWLQVGVVVLLLAQGVQTAIHFYNSQAAQTAPASSPEKLSGFEYVYQPDHLSAVRVQADPQARTITIRMAALPRTCSPASSIPLTTRMLLAR